MTDDSGALSIDFIAGFTIFLLAFIWVLSMIPGLLVNLQGYTIDYDAVAYRTGVILVEDPGWPVSPPWESQQNFSVTRFGLAVSRDTPNILSQEKVDRFFSNTSVYGAFAYPDDYHQRVIFGDYPYRFNISLLDVERNKLQSVGDIIPEGYGYIRRVVKIKSLSNATISNTSSSWQINADNVTSHEFSILVNNSGLKEQKNPAYEIDPARDQITVNITDLRTAIQNTTVPLDSINITLTKINVYKVDSGILSLVRTFNTPYIDENSSSTQPPVEVRENVSLKFTPAFFEILNAGSSPVYINLSFELSTGGPLSTGGTPYPSQFLNNTWTSPFSYDYNPAHVTQPRLRDAMVEVAVW